MIDQPAIIRAPWTSEQVDALNRFQSESGMHPFTCGAEEHTPGSPVLAAAHSGWYCPDPDCGYTQDWAHQFMTQPDAWPKSPWAREGRHGPTPEETRAATPHRDPDPVEPDNPAATALARHITDHPISVVQAAFRELGMRLTFELHSTEEHR